MFDIVTCAHVYEHVPDANRMMQEIHRITRPGGVCYFAAANRSNIKEPHCNLPLQSIVDPRQFVHVYLKVSDKGEFYHEKFLTYWGLKRLVHDFEIIDYTEKIIANTHFFHTGYMISPGTNRARLAKFMAHHVYWLCPGYISLLQKSIR